MTAKHYTGVGSRTTPANIQDLMQSIAVKLEADGYTLRSGGAKGADTAFSDGCTRKKIYRPEQATPAALEIASKFHPVWHRLSDYIKRLHGRNAFQVLGLDLKTPSSFLICWTKDGATTHADRTIETGGTGTAISITDHYKIKIFNLQRMDHIDRLTQYVAF